MSASENMSHFVVMGKQLLGMLESTDAPALSFLLRAVEEWSQEYDRAEKVDVDGCNQMHVIGVSLCVLMNRCAELEQDSYDLRQAMGTASERVLLCDKQLCDYDIQEVQNLVTALQLEFSTLYQLQEETASEAAGYWCLVNMEDIVVRVMTQLGKLQTQAVQELCAERSALAVVHGLLDIKDGFAHVRVETIVFLLDALHSMYSLHSLLTRARFICRGAESPQTCVPVHAHHREASQETFFTQSITADCAVGTIAQYAHRFAHLFHSVSQTIYYNHPTYCRQTQIPLAELEKENVKCVNLLPLLTELRPEIPVLYEHTGAGCRSAHAKHDWSWVLWCNFVLLVDRHLQGIVACDARMLLWHVYK